MNIQEAAKELEISPDLVYKLCRTGALAHARLGLGQGAIRIIPEDLACYVASRRVESKRTPEPRAKKSRVDAYEKVVDNPDEFDGIVSKKVPLIGGDHVTVDIEDFRWAQLIKWKLYQIGEKQYAQGFAPALVRVVAMHRVVAGAVAGQLIDHKNGNGIDNRKQNLRIATPRENMLNRYIPGKGSKFKGVHYDENEKDWVVRILVGKSYQIIGRFEIEEDAAEAYNRAALKEHGEFAWLNPVGSLASSPRVRQGRKPGIWLRSGRSWYTQINGKKYRLASGKESETQARVNLARLLEKMGRSTAHLEPK